MATTNATIAVAVTGQQQVDRLKKSIADTNTTFGGLRNAIAGLAIGAFITKTVGMAAALDDVAGASGISLQAVVGFTDAVAKHGGTAEGAAAAISRFAMAIEAAGNGSKEMQDTFASLNISLEDLRTLSEEDLLARTVEGLAAGGNNASTMTTAMTLLGKSIRSTDFKAVGQDIRAMTAAAAQSASSMAAAAKAEEQFGEAVRTLQRELLQVLEPISRVIVSMGEISGLISGLVKIVLSAGAAYLLFGRALGGAQKATTGLYTIIKAVTGSVGFFGKQIVTMGHHLSRAAGHLGRLVTGLGQLGRLGSLVGLVTQIGKFALRFLGLAGIVISVVQALDLFIDKVLGLGSPLDWLGKKIGELWTAMGFGKSAADEMAENIAAGLKAAEEKRAATNKKVQDAITKESSALQKLVSAYQRVNSEANKKFELDSKMLGVGEDMQLNMTERFSAESRYLGQINDLLDQYREKSASSSESDQRMLPLIQKALQDVTSAYQDQINVIDQLTAARSSAQTVENTRLFGLQQESEALSRLADIQYEIANVTMPAQEKKYKDITYQAQKAAEIAIREEQIRRGTLLTDAEKEKYRQKALESTQKLINKERELTAKSRDFSVGWRKAFNEYVDNATNAARRAEQIFSKLMSSLEDLIVDFVKTGEFNWKSFVSMMAEELLRSQIQQLFGSIMTGMQDMAGQGGILGSIAGLLGGGGASTKGQTASNPMFVYDVGSGGGNPIAGAAQQIFGPPKSAMNTGGGIFETVTSGIGKAVSSVGSVLGSVGSGIFDTIGSIGSSIGDFFGGFFANGGTLGAGKWGIAGERGPEIISGPATITPMGGSTNVTYNINAVDAPSFQALVARDPGFIHAVAMAGAKNMPQARR